MRCSTSAQILLQAAKNTPSSTPLEAERIQNLLALSFEELVDNTTLQQYVTAICHLTKPSQVALASAQLFAEDSIFFETLVEPTLISSGFILSKSTVDSLFSNPIGGRVRCPMTQEILDPRVRILLPQVTQAIQTYRALRDRARQDPTPAVGCDIFQLPSTQLTSTPILSETEMMEVEIKVSGNKVRMLFNTDAISSTSFNELKHRFQAALPSGEIPQTGGGYSVSGWGRCWQHISQDTRLEFWFPSEDRISDEELNALITDTLAPLELPDADLPEGIPQGSIARLQPREYRIAVEKMNISLLKAWELCSNFITKSKSIAESKGVHLTDVARASGPVIGRAVHGGLMLFGGTSAPAQTAQNRQSAPQSMHSTFYTFSSR